MTRSASRSSRCRKYERGANRVGASRLFDLSRILDVPISFFYDNMPESVAGAGHAPRPLAGFAEQQNGFGNADESVNKRETLELVRAYYRITDVNVRKRMFDLMKSMAPVED